MAEHDLLQLRATARAAAAEGRVVTSFSTSGLSGGHQVTMPPHEVLLEVAYALQKLDPVTYGRSLITRRTQARFL
jgi:hypothetical protein